MIRATIASFICMLPILFYSHANANSDMAQQNFVSSVKKSQIEAANAKNDMQRSTIKSNRDSGICESLNNIKVSNWNGKVDSIYAGRDGVGILYVEIAPKILLVSRDMLGKAKASIPKNTKLYDAVSNMSPGDAVTFSGEFIPDGGVCADEASITLEGGLSEPNFIFRFTDVKGISAKPENGASNGTTKKPGGYDDKVIEKLHKGFFDACVSIGKGDDASAMKALDRMGLPGDGKTTKITKEEFQGIKTYFLQYRNLNQDTCVNYSNGFVTEMLSFLSRQ
ncbi:TPA: hypothetical protein ACSTLU_000166 [Serratia fonticola]